MKKLLALLNTPLRLVFVLGSLVLTVELLIMEVIHDVLVPMIFPEVYWGFVDTALLTTIVAPALYFLVSRKIQEDEQRLRQVEFSAQDAIVIVNEQGRITDWNLAAQKMFQYSSEEAVGQPMHQLIAPPRYHADAARGFASFQKTGKGPLIGKTTEILALRKDGSEFPIELSISAVKVKGRWHAMGIMRDITERKQAEDSLRKLSLAVEQSPSSIVITDLDANIEYANAAFVKATGYSMAEAVGQNPRLLHSGKTPRATYDDLWAHLTRGELWKGEFINQRKDGSEYIEAVLISPVRQSDGRVTNYLAIKEDITQRRQIEDALRVSEAGIRAIVEHSPIAMIVDIGVDADEKIMMMNQKFTELFGYTMEDVPDVRHWWPLAYPDEKYREELKAEWIGKVEKAIQRHGDIEPMETTVTCKDASIRYVRISLASTGNRNIITFEDLTERKLAESKLAEQLDELRRWHEATSGRERRILELKHEMNELLGKSGLPPRYPSAELSNAE